MKRIMDMADEWQREREKPTPGTIDGHDVESVLCETEKMIIFRDADGRLWRRVHAWGMTWPVEVVD